MKVIFLDFDGVLNSATSFLYESNRRKKHKEQGVKGPLNQTLSLHCCAAFQEVLDTYPDVKIVLSTTWRVLFSIDWLKDKLSEHKIDSSRVIGQTPEDRLGGDRGKEILWWLDKHPEVTHYAIIDDNDWGITAIHGEGRFVKTEWEHGMHVGHTFELINKLKNENAVKMKEWDDAKKIEADKAMEEFLKNRAAKKKLDDNF